MAQVPWQPRGEVNEEGAQRSRFEVLLDRSAGRNQHHARWIQAVSASSMDDHGSRIGIPVRAPEGSLSARRPVRGQACGAAADDLQMHVVFVPMPVAVEHGFRGAAIGTITAMDTRPAPQPLNVVVIICDDLCWGDVARHGNRIVHTPELDRLHDQSARCTRWCSGPLCSPARASLMTGRWHLRTRVIDTYCGRSIIEPSEPTLGKVFAAAGYATGCFGKWHLGDCSPCRPSDQGFAESLWHRAGGIGQPGDLPENRRPSSYFSPVLLRGNQPVSTTGYCTDIFTDAAIAFITEPRQEPFLCYLAYNAPHSPLEVADEWADPYRHTGINETHARLYGMVTNLDWNVGRLRAALAESGLAEHTLLLFTSDHGPCGSARNREAPVGSQDRWNAGLRDIKGSVYEGGIRVPAFWHLPGRCLPHDIAAPCHPIDVLPTLCQWAGVPRPDLPLDGVDLGPALRGDGVVPERLLTMQWHRGDQPEMSRNYAVIAPRWKLVRSDPTSADELYDVESDPGEAHNVAATYPEQVERLRAAYLSWFADVAGTRGITTFDPGPIHVGSMAEPCVLLTQQDWRIVGVEGWLRDDLRGVWPVTVTRSGMYHLTAFWRADAPSGQRFVRVQAQTWPIAGPEGLRLQLSEGPCTIEAWLEVDAPPVAGLLAGRYLAATDVTLSLDLPRA